MPVKIKRNYSGFDAVAIIVSLVGGNFVIKSIESGRVYVRAGYIYESESYFMFWLVISIISLVIIYAVFSLFFIDFTKWERKD